MPRLPRLRRRRPGLGEPGGPPPTEQARRRRRRRERRRLPRLNLRRSQTPERPRRVPRLPRPRLPSRDRISRVSGQRLPKDIGFRASTRVKALGYGLRELAWRVSGRAGRIEDSIRRRWVARSPQTRRRITAVAAVLLAYSLVKFAALPAVPCEVSAVKECSPGDETVAKVPSGALLYAHLTLDDDSAQFDRALEVAGRLPRSAELGQFILDQIAAPSGAQITYAADIEPWAGNDVAATILAGPDGTDSAVLIAVEDREGAEGLIAKVAPGQPTKGDQEGVEVSTYPGGFATAFDGGLLFLGDDTAVTQLIATGRGDNKSLERDAAAAAIRDGLPENRFADVYLSAAGTQQLLAGSASTAATQLETFVNYGATRGFAAAAVAHDEGYEVEVVSSLDPKKAEESPGFFSTLKEFRPSITDEVGSRALGYIGIGAAGESLSSLLRRAGSVQPGLAEQFTAFTARLEAEAKVDPTRDLLPALGGEAAIVAEPTDGIPFASLIVEDVDENRARDVLARLQAPLVRSINPPKGIRQASFKTSEIDGSEAHSLQVSPTVNLTYAVFDDKLVISTDPAGIEQVKEGGGERLQSSSQFETAAGRLPERLSALVFFNLDELLDLAEALGRVEDPLYASFRDDIRKLHAIALGVSAEGDLLRSELFLTID